LLVTGKHSSPTSPLRYPFVLSRPQYERVFLDVVGITDERGKNDDDSGGVQEELSS